MAAIRRGELRVDQSGAIWRCTNRSGNRWSKERVLVRSIAPKRAEHRMPQGYLQVRMMIRGQRHHIGAHRIVYMALVGTIPHGMTINHKNGIKDDNHPDNLEAVTYSQNNIHAVRVLKVGKAADQNGEKNCQSKLTAKDVERIRTYAEYIMRDMKTRHGRMIATLAREHGVAYQTIWDIIKGRTWIS